MEKKKKKVKPERGQSPPILRENNSIPEQDGWHNSLMNMNPERAAIAADFAMQAEKETDIPG